MSRRTKMLLGAAALGGLVALVLVLSSGDEPGTPGDGEVEAPPAQPRVEAPAPSVAPAPPSAPSLAPVPASVPAPARASAPIEAPASRERPQWVGPGEPSLVPPVPQELEPMDVSYAQMAEQLRDLFPHMDEPPPTPAHELEYHQYAEDMMAQLHLGGDRHHLELARLTLFDRLNAPPEKLAKQSEMVKHFVHGAFGGEESLPELVQFVSVPVDPQGPKQVLEKSWQVGDKQLTATVLQMYGMVVLTVIGKS